MCYTELTRETPKARKPHKCNWCGHAILVGERYEYVAASVDREFQVTRLHLECDDALDCLLRDCPEAAESCFDMRQPRGRVGDWVYEEHDLPARRTRDDT